jgi:hypothetical protein
MLLLVVCVQVYVLLFGVGQKDTEGIYSLRAVSDDGLPTETIIAFENMEDAIRWAILRQQQQQHLQQMYCLCMFMF